MFWLYEEELPAGVGSVRFGAGHLAYLAFFLALTLCYAFFYKRLDARRRKSADRILGAAVLFFALCAYGLTALLGHRSRYGLPLHVCSLLFFLAPLHAWANDAGLRGFLGMQQMKLPALEPTEITSCSTIPHSCAVCSSTSAARAMPLDMCMRQLS